MTSLCLGVSRTNKGKALHTLPRRKSVILQCSYAAIITSRISTKAKLPTHVPIKAQQGLGHDSLVLLEQIRTIDKMRLNEYIGTLDSEAISQVDRALAVSVGLKGRN